MDYSIHIFNNLLVYIVNIYGLLSLGNNHLCIVSMMCLCCSGCSPPYGLHSLGMSLSRCSTLNRIAGIGFGIGSTGSLPDCLCICNIGLMISINHTNKLGKLRNCYILCILLKPSHIYNIGLKINRIHLDNLCRWNLNYNIYRQILEQNISNKHQCLNSNRRHR